MAKSRAVKTVEAPREPDEYMCREDMNTLARAAQIKADKKRFNAAVAMARSLLRDVSGEAGKK